MTKKQQRWLSGEILRKRWGVNERTLETFAFNGLPAYDWNGETMDSADGFNHIDTYRFSIKDIEEFERDHPELLAVKKEIPEPASKHRADLGKRMTATEVATMLDVDVKTVRNRFEELGGMR